MREKILDNAKKISAEHLGSLDQVQYYLFGSWARMEEAIICKDSSKMDKIDTK